MKNTTFATNAAPAATPPNPNTAAISAIIKNVAGHLNISIGFCVFKKIVSLFLEQNIMPMTKQFK